MDFKVCTTPDGRSVHHTGRARFDLEHGGSGVLQVWAADGTKTIYGPAGWLRVEVLDDGTDSILSARELGV